MSLFQHLSMVEENRSHINQRHDLVDVLFLVLTAVASGQDGWAEIQQFGELKLDWLRKFRPFKNGIPRRHTIARIMPAVSNDSLQLCLFSWINEIRTDTGQTVIAIDGKTLRGASKRGEHRLHSVAAYDIDNGLALYQEVAPGKTGEITAVQQLITMLNIDGVIITFDALNTQRQTLADISARNGDFIGQVKGNQPTLHDFVISEFDEAFKDDANIPQFETTDKGHGREEKRITFQIPANLPPELRKKWPSINTLVAVERHRKDSKSNVLDTSFFVSSCGISPEKMSNSIRGHWQVENSLNWVLDVVFKEDACRVYDTDSAKALASLRRIVLNMAKLETTQKRSMKSKIHRALLSDEYRELMIFGSVNAN